MQGLTHLMDYLILVKTDWLLYNVWTSPGLTSSSLVQGNEQKYGQLKEKELKSILLFRSFTSIPPTLERGLHSIQNIQTRNFFTKKFLKPFFSTSLKKLFSSQTFFTKFSLTTKLINSNCDQTKSVRKLKNLN